MFLDDGVDLADLLRRSEIQSGPQALCKSRITTGAAEDESDGREQSGLIELSDDVRSWQGPEIVGTLVAAASSAATRLPALDAFESLTLLDVANQILVDEHGLRPGSRMTTTVEEIEDSPTDMMCCHSGIGRVSSTTTVVSPRTVSIQAPNSSALLTVADKLTRRTSSDRCRITSSHTAPRNRSAR